MPADAPPPYPRTDDLRDPLERPFRVLVLGIRGMTPRNAAIARRNAPEMTAILRRHCAPAAELDAALATVERDTLALADALEGGADGSAAHDAARRGLFSLKDRIIAAPPSAVSDGLWRASLSRVKPDKA